MATINGQAVLRGRHARIVVRVCSCRLRHPGRLAAPGQRLHYVLDLTCGHSRIQVLKRPLLLGTSAVCGECSAQVDRALEEARSHV